MDAKRATTPEERHELREVVGLFDTVDTLQSAIDDLLTGGFDRSEISLLAEEDKVREKLGDTDVSADSLEDSPRAPRTPYIDSELLNIGKASIVGVLFYVGAFIGAGVTLAWVLSLTSAIAVGLLTGGARRHFGPAGFEARRRPPDQMGAVAVEAWRTAALGPRLERRARTRGDGDHAASTAAATCMRMWEA